jgi:hypothetical protein
MFRLKEKKLKIDQYHYISLTSPPTPRKTTSVRTVTISILRSSRPRFRGLGIKCNVTQPKRRELGFEPRSMSASSSHEEFPSEHFPTGPQFVGHLMMKQFG